MSRIDEVSQMLAQEDQAEIDLTPMLDVVFIMLIFFIVTASFVKELALDVNTPPAQELATTDNKSVTVVIRSNDEIEINGLSVDKRAVAAQIVRAKAENPKATVSVLAHSKSRAETLVSVVNSIKEAGIKESVPINELTN